MFSQSFCFVLFKILSLALLSYFVSVCLSPPPHFTALPLHLPKDALINYCRIGSYVQNHLKEHFYLCYTSNPSIRLSPTPCLVCGMGVFHPQWWGWAPNTQVSLPWLLLLSELSALSALLAMVCRNNIALSSHPCWTPWHYSFWWSRASVRKFISLVLAVSFCSCSWPRFVCKGNAVSDFLEERWSASVWMDGIPDLPDSEPWATDEERTIKILAVLRQQNRGEKNNAWVSELSLGWFTSGPSYCPWAWPQE